MKRAFPFLATLSIIAWSLLMIVGVFLIFIPPAMAQRADGDVHLPLIVNTAAVAVTATPPPTPVETQTAAITPLYAGPDNVGYPILTTLPADRAVTPTGIYGEFIAVEVVAQARTDEAQSGYVWQDDLVNLPADLPLLTFSDVPPRTRTIVPADLPLTFDLFEEGYHRYPIFGSAVRATTNLTLDTNLAMTLDAATPDNAANGIMISTEDGQRGIVIALQSGAWRIFRYDDGAIVLNQQLMTTSATSGAISLSLIDAFQTAVVDFGSGQRFTVEIGEPIFHADETFYFHAHVAPESIVEIGATSIEQAPTGLYDEILPRGQPLRELAAARGIMLGTIPDGGWYGTELDHQLVARHTDLQVWHVNWNEAPNLITSTRLAFGKVNDIRTRAHPLIWHEQLPDWLENGEFTDEELTEIMRDHIFDLMTRHEAEEWVVVNEAVADGGGIDGFVDNVFLRAFGEEYIDMAFRFAREADPDAVLIYNDYGIETPGQKTDRVFALMQRMLAAGVPVDALGTQNHLLICSDTVPSKADLLTNMTRFATLGVDLHITELDVNLVRVDGTEEEKWALQADIYQDVMESCLETAACKSFSTWGFSDPYSWLHTFSCGGEAPLLFDDDYLPKPSFLALESALTSSGVAAINATAIAPMIDGIMDAVWADANAFGLEKTLIGDDVTAPDLGGEFRVLYDSDHLYFLIDVVDDDLRNDSGELWWEDDAVEIYLDGDNSRADGYDGVNDYQLVIRWNADEVIAGPNSAAPPENLSWDGMDTEAGYRVEVAVPLSAIGVDGAGGAMFGLDVHLIDDDDGDEREGKLSWHATVDESWKNPRTFGAGRLQP